MRLNGQLQRTVTLTLALNITRAVKTHLSFQRSKPLLRVHVMGFKKMNYSQGFPLLQLYSDQTSRGRGEWRAGERAQLRLPRFLSVVESGYTGSFQPNFGQFIFEENANLVFFSVVCLIRGDFGLWGLPRYFSAIEPVQAWWRHARGFPAT